MPRFMLEGPLKNLHYLLFSVHTLYIYYVMKTRFLGWFLSQKKKKLLCFVQGQNHSPALTVAILTYVYSGSF